MSEEKIREFEHALKTAAEELDPFWRTIRDDFPKAETSAVVELGDAIISMNKIRSRIYIMIPELQPENWSGNTKGKKDNGTDI